MAPIWITGAGGLIGSYLAKKERSDLTPLTRRELDLTDFKAVRERFAKDKPACVIHCAALSRSTDCEADPSLAKKLNVDVTRLFAQLSAKIPFVFFSTDLVFDGRTGNYDEAAAVNPLSVYAATKVEAERIVLANPMHTVIRTSLNGGTSPTGDRGFNEQMRRAWEAGRTLNLFTDEFRSPIAAAMTARATREIIAANRPGLYHVAGAERISRFEIGRLLADRAKELNPKIIAGSLREYSGAPRPPDVSLNCAKAQSLLSFQLPSFREWLLTQADF